MIEFPEGAKEIVELGISKKCILVKNNEFTYIYETIFYTNKDKTFR